MLMREASNGSKMVIREESHWDRVRQVSVFYGASGRIRTDDLLITNQLLCQLSYAGVNDNL